MLNPFNLTSQLTSSELSFVQNIAGLSYAQGDILYYDGSNLNRLPAGTSGWFLKTQGAGANPTWVAVPGGGDVLKVGTPANNQVGVWTGDGTIEGDVDLTFDTASNTFTIAGVGGTSIVAIGGANILVDSPRGTMTLSNIDALDATTIATFNAALSFGTGNVTKAGTPVNNQVGVWTGDGTIEGDASLTWDGTNFNIATAKNFQIAGTTILADAAGTTTLSNIDALDSTTKSTIEAAIDTLVNLTSIQGRTVTFSDAGANAIFGWDDVASAYENLTAGEARIVLGLATTDSPMFTAIELGHASDTTIARSGAGAITVEGVQVALNSISLAHTASTLELGHASDTTLSRSSAGILAVEGVTVPLNSTTNTHTAQQIELGHASDTTIARVSAGVASIEGNTIITTASTATRTLVLSAAGGTPTTTIGCAASTKIEAGTNDVDYYVLDFDTTTEERAFWVVAMPDNYDGGTVTAKFYWTNASGSSTQTVDWGIKARSFADDEAIDQAYGTEITTTDTWLAQGDVHISAASSAITIGGTPAGGELVIFNVGRKVGTDNMTGDARLIAVKIEYGINAYSD